MNFDDYVMVDWSANSAPKTGKDSIWWCAGGWRDGRLRVTAPRNPATRSRAMEDIALRLEVLVGEGRSVLVGFDFPLGYPAGLARSLGLAGQPWRAVWMELSRLIRDDQAGSSNNRFAVAADLNRRLGGAGPFWGCPEAAQGVSLLTTKPARFGALAEFRVTERRIRGPKSVWQLFYNGSVGSQALLGIPLLAKLRHRPSLAGWSAVWPFETGALLPPRSAAHARVIHAEVYPSFIPAAPAPFEVKDASQVRALVQHFAARDRKGLLQDDFAAPTMPAAVREEGWILGS